MAAGDGEDAGHVERTPTVVASLSVGGRPGGFEVDDVIGVVRRAVEDLVQRAMGIEMTWSTYASVSSDDLESGLTRTGVDGLDWSFARGRLRADMPRTLAITGVSTVLYEAFHQDPDMDRYNPRMYVADVSARFPPERAARWPSDGLTVRVAMSRWAMYGGGERLDWIAPAITDWMLGAGVALGADSGYALADAPALTSDDTDWQQENGLQLGRHDPKRWLHAYGWGTLLGPGHLQAVGGIERLRAVSPLVHELPGGRAWVQLGDDPAVVTDDTLEQVRSALSAALP